VQEENETLDDETERNDICRELG